MTYNTIQRVCVPNVRRFGQVKTDLMTKEVEEFLLALNSYDSYIYWYIDLKLAENFQKGVIYIV